MNNTPQNPENPEKKPFDRAAYNREYQKEYRKKNAEKNKAYQKQYYEEHKEERKAYGKEYREEHKEEAKEYRKNNPEKKKESDRKYREKNSEKIKKEQKERYHSDIEKSREQGRRNSKKYRETHPERPRASQKKFRENNKPKCRKQHSDWWKKKYHSDPLFRLLHNARNRICEILKCQDLKKSQTTVELIGCTPEFLKSYLESKFTEGMSWDNYGYTGWHVDHIIPCSSFDLSDEEQLKKCFHYTNLQPLWGEDNIKKGNKIL